MTRYLLVVPLIALAVIAWGAAVYATLKGVQHRVPGRWTTPLISRNPNYITPEGIVWRKRFYLSAGAFAVLILFAMVIGALLRG